MRGRGTESTSLRGCSVISNSADYGGGVCPYSGSVTLSDCSLISNSAEYGAGLYIKTMTTFSNCLLTSNSASYYGGGFYNSDSTATISDCTLKANSASYYGGGLYNIGGTATFSGCLLTANSATEGGGAFNRGAVVFTDSNLTFNNASDICYSTDYDAGDTWGSKCDAYIGYPHWCSAYDDDDFFSSEMCCACMGGSGSYGGGLYDAGTSTLIDCQLTANSGRVGKAVFIADTASSSFSRCLFRGHEVSFSDSDSDSDSCVVYSGSFSELRLYYTKQAIGGEFCTDSSATILVYNSEASIPFSDWVSYSPMAVGLISCQHDDINNYCAFDCSAGVESAGIECSCTADGDVRDPRLVASEGGCENSPQVLVLNRDIEVSINKADATSLRQLVFFSNTGDNDLTWRYDLASNNGSETIAWSAAPVSGNLTTCDIGNVTVTLHLSNTQARSEPYVLTFTMTSSSFLEPSRAIPIELSVTVSASVSASLCTVELKNAEPAVADTLEFTIMSNDAYGIRVLDVAALTYSATLANADMSNDLTCTVLYDSNSDKHDGRCILPADNWGNFTLTVLDSANRELVGDRTYNIPVTACSVDHYWDGVGCVACDPKSISCAKGSTLQTILLKPRYWREGASSPLGFVRSCDPRPKNCLGTLPANTTGSVARRTLAIDSTFDSGCVDGSTGPLCATCKIGYAQTPEFECTYCDPGSKVNGALFFGTLLVVAVLVATIGGRLVQRCSSSDEGREEGKNRCTLLVMSLIETFKDHFWSFRDKGKIMLTYFQIVSQQVGGCVTVPWPSAYGGLVAKLGVINLNIVPYFSASCLLPRTNFYAAFLTSTAGPIVLISAIFAYYLSRRERGPSSDNSQLQAKLASYALAVSYLAFPNGSLITFRAFACDWGFDDEHGFLKYDYSCSCTGGAYVFGWKYYGAFRFTGYMTEYDRCTTITNLLVCQGS